LLKYFVLTRLADIRRSYLTKANKNDNREKINSSLPSQQRLGDNCFGWAKSPTNIKIHPNGIEIITWQNDHSPILRARVETKSLQDPSLLSIKDNPLQRTIHVSRTWPIHPHGGPYCVLNPNILLYINIHTSIPMYEIPAPPILKLLISHSFTDLSVEVLTFLQVSFPPKKPEIDPSSSVIFNNQLVNMS
jgi:hypothetical protein